MSESTDGPCARGRSCRLGEEKRRDFRLRIKSGEMSTKGEEELGPGIGRLCHLGWQVLPVAQLVGGCHAPDRAQGLVALVSPPCSEGRLPFEGCIRRQSFSLGEWREKGPGAGCAMLESMRKGYSSRWPHPIGDGQ